MFVIRTEDLLDVCDVINSAVDVVDPDSGVSIEVERPENPGLLFFKDVMSVAKHLIVNDRPFQAIKVIKQGFNIGLGEAKCIVDTLRDSISYTKKIIEG